MYLWQKTTAILDSYLHVPLTENYRILIWGVTLYVPLTKNYRILIWGITLYVPLTENYRILIWGVTLYVPLTENYGILIWGVTLYVPLTENYCNTGFLLACTSNRKQQDTYLRGNLVCTSDKKLLQYWILTCMYL